jgi:urease accessory protein
MKPAAKHIWTIAAFAAALAPAAAQAHVGRAAGGAAAGLLHPLSGLDHLLATVAVGLWAVQLGGRMTWALPLSFLACMAAGGACISLPEQLVEGMILASVLALGALIAFGFRTPPILAVIATGAFALFHGYAHANEKTSGASAFSYGLGILISTAALHVAGIILALTFGHRCEAGRRLVRVTGAAILACGVLLVAGAI